MKQVKDENRFLELGFTKVDTEKDPITWFEKRLVSDEVIEENELQEDEIPTLFLGTNGFNTGFGIFTGSCVIWLNVATPEEAVEFASKISEFETVLI